MLDELDRFGRPLRRPREDGDDARHFIYVRHLASSGNPDLYVHPQDPPNKSKGLSALRRCDGGSSSSSRKATWPEVCTHEASGLAERGTSLRCRTPLRYLRAADMNAVLFLVGGWDVKRRPRLQWTVPCAPTMDGRRVPTGRRGEAYATPAGR